MTPIVPDVLLELSGLLVRNAAPDADPADRASALGLSAALLGIAAQEWDRAAARLIDENRAVREILAAARGVLGQGDLADRLDGLAAGQDADFRVSALQASNDRLRAALTELHAALEGRPEAAARALEDRIWAELAASTERRLIAGSAV